MFDQPTDFYDHSDITNDTCVAQTARTFLAEHGHGLPGLVGLLGGRRAEAGVCDLIDGVATGRLSDRQIVKAVNSIHAVLDLRHVGDPDRIETALFAEIDPASEIVHDLCAMTDAVADLSGQLSRIAARPY